MNNLTDEELLRLVLMQFLYRLHDTAALSVPVQDLLVLIDDTVKEILERAK